MRTEKIILLAVLLLVVVVGGFRYKKSKKEYRIFFFLMVITFITEILAEFCAVRYRNNLMVYNLFNIVESVLLSFFYISLFNKNWLKKLAAIVLAAFLLFAIFNILYLQKNQLATNSIIFESLFIVVYSLALLFQYLGQTGDENLLTKPALWFNIRNLFFFATNLFFWGYYRKMMGENKPALRSFYEIIYYENLILYLVVAAGFWLIGNRRSFSNSD